jgi:hypothetical protein
VPVAPLNAHAVETAIKQAPGITGYRGIDSFIVSQPLFEGQGHNRLQDVSRLWQQCTCGGSNGRGGGSNAHVGDSSDAHSGSTMHLLDGVAMHRSAAAAMHSPEYY